MSRILSFLLLLALAPAPLLGQRYATEDGSTRVALVKMPYRGARNVPELSPVPDYLQAGGIELNPVAGALLETGRGGFVFWKSFLIGMALVVLAIHKNFYLARIGLWTAAGTYTLLLIYHLSLFQ